MLGFYQYQDCSFENETNQRWADMKKKMEEEAWNEANNKPIIVFNKKRLCIFLIIDTVNCVAARGQNTNFQT